MTFEGLAHGLRPERPQPPTTCSKAAVRQQLVEITAYSLLVFGQLGFLDGALPDPALQFSIYVMPGKQHLVSIDTVIASTALAHVVDDAACSLRITPMFLASISLSRLYGQYCRGRGRRWARPR
jgi:hypothetical protein